MRSRHLAQCFASWENSVPINYSLSVLKYSRCGSCPQVQIQSRSLWGCGACQGYFVIDALIQSKFIHKEEEPEDGRHDHKKWSERSFSSVTQLCLNLQDAMVCSTPGFPVHHQLPELAQTHVHWVGDAIQPSHPLSSPSLPAFNLSQHQDLFQGVSASHQVDKVLEFQLQHRSSQWIFRTE